MKKPPTMRAKSGPVTVHLPVLDDATAAVLYNVLCDLVDRFDAHYGEQICRFYSRQDDPHTSLPPPSNPDDPPSD